MGVFYLKNYYIVCPHNLTYGYSYQLKYSTLFHFIIIINP